MIKKWFKCISKSYCDNTISVFRTYGMISRSNHLVFFVLYINCTYIFFCKLMMQLIQNNQTFFSLHNTTGIFRMIIEMVVIKVIWFIVMIQTTEVSLIHKPQNTHTHIYIVQTHMEIQVLIIPTLVIYRTTMMP